MSGRLSSRKNANLFLPSRCVVTGCRRAQLRNAALRGFSGTFLADRASYSEDQTRGTLDSQSLVDLHYGPLDRFAMSLTRTESDSCDLVQQTSLTCATKGNQVLGPSKVNTWLYRTLHRAFLESWRRITRFPDLEITALEADLPNFEPELVSHLNALDVIQLLGQVDEQFQAAVSLFYLENYSYNEIAGILDIPLGTAKSRIARGLAQLRELAMRKAGAPGQSMGGTA
ncbi:MAG: RNA polymerase sigma factor [Verrucomicrobia bacterium]|nr:RNA polymerase sigma factor [Verrucomicrobiota bacterium]